MNITRFRERFNKNGSIQFHESHKLDPRFLGEDSKSIQSQFEVAFIWHHLRKDNQIGFDQKMKLKTADGLKNQDVS